MAGREIQFKGERGRRAGACPFRPLPGVSLSSARGRHGTFPPSNWRHAPSHLFIGTSRSAADRADNPRKHERPERIGLRQAGFEAPGGSGAACQTRLTNHFRFARSNFPQRSFRRWGGFRHAARQFRIGHPARAICRGHGFERASLRERVGNRQESSRRSQKHSLADPRHFSTSPLITYTY